MKGLKKKYLQVLCGLGLNLMLSKINSGLHYEKIHIPSP